MYLVVFVMSFGIVIIPNSIKYRGGYALSNVSSPNKIVVMFCILMLVCIGVCIMFSICR